MGGDFGRQRLARRDDRTALAREQQHRRLAQMIPQIGAGLQHAGELPVGQMRRPAARGIDRLRDIGSLAIDHPELAALLGVAHDDKHPVLGVAGRWRADRGVEDLADQLFGDRIGLEPAQRPRRIDRFEQPDIGHCRSLRCGRAFLSAPIPNSWSRMTPDLQQAAETERLPLKAAWRLLRARATPGYCFSMAAGANACT